jgi:hypothetical protein
VNTRDPRRHARITWFEFGLGLFLVSVPVGAVLMAVAPLSFFHFLGAVVVGTGLVGAWVCALGLRLEHPDRWHALKSWFRRAATVPGTAPAAAETRVP